LQPTWSALLLKALQFMAFSRSGGPDTFFDFNGKNASLLIPEGIRWPQKVLPAALPPGHSVLADY
jgi:hypothetical protein